MAYPKHEVPRETLRKLYVDDNMTLVEISKVLGISRMALNRIMKEERLSRRIEGLVNIHNRQPNETRLD